MLKIDDGQTYASMRGQCFFLSKRFDGADGADGIDSQSVHRAQYSSFMEMTKKVQVQPATQPDMVLRGSGYLL